MIIVDSVAKRVDRAVRVSRLQRVDRCEPVQTNVRWPVPVDQRLNELLDRLTDAGGSASRSELLAALVTSAPTDGRKLEATLVHYRSRKAGDVVTTQGPIIVPIRRPGRRPR